MEKRIELEKRAREPNRITLLNLDNCRSTTIVGLTDEYTALETLSLINVGLTTLKGFPKLPSLKRLELSDNRISNGLHYLTTCPKIEYLNLSGNMIKDLETLKPLQELKHLETLDLFNNDATRVDNYREKIFKMLPALDLLDGFDCNDVEAQSEGEEEDGIGAEDDSDSDDDDEDDDEEENENSNFSLYDVYNDNIVDDSEEWEGSEHGEEEEDSDIDEEANESTGSAKRSLKSNNTQNKSGDNEDGEDDDDNDDDDDDDDDDEDDRPTPGKKRKHEI